MPAPGPADRNLAAFRGDLRASLPLHPLEKALVWTVALNACTLPWLLGGMRPWSQFITFGLSVVALMLALWPRHYTSDYAREGEFTLHMWPKLLRFPLFWIGLLFLAYGVVQALNPAWTFVQKEKSWTMRPLEHIAWLPTGMDTPFAMMNTWRQLLIWTAPFLLVCAVWTGFTRRKSAVALLTALVANATVLAVVGIVARYTAPDKILWLVSGVKNYCFSSFIYKNHAGSFFALAVGLALALAVYHHGQATRHMRRSSPAPVLVFIAMILAIAVLQTYSRAAILITGVFLLVAGVLGGLRLVFGGGARQVPLLIGVFLLGAVTFAGVGSKLVNSDLTLDRIHALTRTDRIDFSVLTRSVAWQAGLEMAEEQPVYGWGAGGFRFLFPRYQMSRPDIVWLDPKRQRGFMFWEHAHNDYLQFLIETGRAGMAWLGVGLLTWLAMVFRHGGRRNLTAVTLLGAIGITLTHAATDFPLQNPAVLMTVACAAVLALLVPHLESRGR